ncbi:MAG: MFS transporter [Acidimicrobiales bacterium]
MKYERLIAICFSTVMVMAGQGVVSPVLPLYADDFGVSTALIGATVTAFGLARLVVNIPAGVVADQRGRRFLLIGGPLVTAVGMFGSGISPSIWVLLAFRFIAGLGSGLYMTGAQIYLLDIAGPEQRGRFIATNQGALLAGVSAGPALGGFLADRYGLSAPFLVVAGAALFTAIYGYLRLPETRPTSAPTDERSNTGIGGTAVSRLDLLRSVDFLAVGFVAIGVFSIRAGVRQTLVPLHLSAAFGLEVSELGLLFTLLGVIGLVLIWPAGWAADRFGRKILIVPTAALMAVGMGLVSVAESLTLFVIGLTISAIGSGITGPAPAAFVADLVGDEKRGMAMGMYRTFGDIGVVGSPVLSGMLADATSIPVAIGANAVFIGAAAVFFGVFASEPHRVTPDDLP